MSTSFKAERIGEKQSFAYRMHLMDNKIELFDPVSQEKHIISMLKRVIEPVVNPHISAYRKGKKYLDTYTDSKQMDHLQKARFYLQKSLKHKPDFSLALEGLAKIYLELAKRYGNSQLYKNKADDYLEKAKKGNTQS